MQAKDRYFWMVAGWSNRSATVNGTSFSIWVSPEFVKVAKSIEMTPDIKANFQRNAQSIIQDAGWEVRAMGPEQWAQFGEYGLMHFAVPGSATGLDWDMQNDRPEEDGAMFVPHNVDSFMQQSALMGIWLHWTQFVDRHDSPLP